MRDKDQRIKDLEAEIRRLSDRINVLEARPFTITQPPVIQPLQPYNPWPGNTWTVETSKPYRHSPFEVVCSS